MRRIALSDFLIMRILIRQFECPIFVPIPANEYAEDDIFLSNEKYASVGRLGILWKKPDGHDDNTKQWFSFFQE